MTPLMQRLIHARKLFLKISLELMDNHQMTLPKVMFPKQLPPIWPQLLQPSGLPTKRTLRSSSTVLLLSLDLDKVGLEQRLAIKMSHSQLTAPTVMTSHMLVKILHLTEIEATQVAQD